MLFAGLTSVHAELRTSNLWWAPECVTTGGHKIDELLMVIFWLTLAVFIATQAVYIYFIIKYRYRKGVKAVYSHGNNALEIVWTTIPAAIFILLAVTSDKLWLQLRAGRAQGGAHARYRGLPVRIPHPQPRQGRQARSYAQEWMNKGDNNFGTDPTRTTPTGTTITRARISSRCPWIDR